MVPSLGAPLQIADFSFRQYEGGPAWAAGYQPASGDTVCTEFRLSGLATKEGEFDDSFGYRYRISALDEQGRPWADPATGKVEGTVSDEDKKSSWRPKVSACFATPALLGAREFQVTAAVEDLIGGAEVTFTARFQLRGPVLPRSTAIAAHGFRFLRQEEDSEPLRVAAFRAGDMVWGRFEMTGFALTPTGAVQVAYGLQVFNPAGRKLFELPIAAEETREFPYPPDYLPGVVSLQLQPKTPTGEYAIELTVTDRVRGDSSASRQTFRIE